MADEEVILSWAALTFVALAAFGYVILRVTRVDITPLLTRREWIAALQVLVLVGLVSLVLMRLINRDLPADIFIYGRF